MEAAIQILTGLLALAGGGFALIAAIGVARLPDVYTRMHAATKAGTLGAGLILVAVAFDAGEIGMISRALACFVFLLLTAPISGHLLGRAAYLTGVPLWERTIADDLKGRYGPDGKLAGAPELSKLPVTPASPRTPA